MKLTIHRGTHEIGGNCLEISTENSRIILDVGMPLFDEDRQPRDTAALRRQSAEELLNSRVLPNVPGLFAEGPPVDAILISHAHEDHTGLLRHSNANIPIFASNGTSKMMWAGSKFAGQPEMPIQRHRGLTSGQSVVIGDFTVTAFSVDHSIFGAQAFLIESGGKSVLYSGDMRMHGRKPGMHRTLIDTVKDRRIDVLLMEGTHICHPEYRGPNEYDLEKMIAGHMESAAGLVLASFSPQHVDRLVGFLRATNASGRAFVADAYTAYVMHLIASETSIPRPESTKWVRVFFPKFFEESYRRKKLIGFVKMMSPVRIQMEEIRANPTRFVMLFRPSMLESDLGGSLPQQSRCLYSRWSGYLDQPDWQHVKAAFAAANGDLIEAHTSGHIFADDIVRFVREVGPKSVVPIHTFEAERFRQHFAHVHTLKDGEVLEVH